MGTGAASGLTRTGASEGFRERFRQDFRKPSLRFPANPSHQEPTATVKVHPQPRGQIMVLQWRYLRCHAFTRVAEAVSDQSLGPTGGNVRRSSVAGGERAAAPGFCTALTDAGSIARGPHLRYACALPGVLAAITLVACGGSNDATATAPSAPPSALDAIAYDSPAVFTVGVFNQVFADAAISPFSTITVSPALPAGLTINPSTGTIAGTPTVVSPGQEYTVSAANAQGTVTTKVALEVDDNVLFYPSPAILALGVAMSPLIPNSTTRLSAYSVEPALPEGLSLDPKTGIISGTPTQPSSPSYYEVISTDYSFQRQYGLTLAVADPSASPGSPSAAPFNCVHSGGFVGTFTVDAGDKSYGLIAIAFTPDGHAKARVYDLTAGDAYDSDGLQALSPAMNGTFEIGFADAPDVSIRGSFSGTDFISGTFQHGATVKSFSAARLGGSAKAQYRYSGGFGRDGGYRVDFGTVDVTGSALSGAGYQMFEPGSNYLLVNRQLSFASTIADGMFTVMVGDDDPSTWPYTAGQSSLALGDPYDLLFYIETLGCQLN
jgi:hypothetical protein